MKKIILLIAWLIAIWSAAYFTKDLWLYNEITVEIYSENGGEGEIRKIRKPKKIGTFKTTQNMWPWGIYSINKDWVYAIYSYKDRQTWYQLSDIKTGNTKILEYGYITDWTVVYYGNHKINEVDINSFVPLHWSIAKDKKNIYYATHVFSGMDTNNINLLCDKSWEEFVEEDFINNGGIVKSQWKYRSLARRLWDSINFDEEKEKEYCSNGTYRRKIDDSDAGKWILKPIWKINERTSFQRDQTAPHKIVKPREYTDIKIPQVVKSAQKWEYTIFTLDLSSANPIKNKKLEDPASCDDNKWSTCINIITNWRDDPWRSMPYFRADEIGSLYRVTDDGVLFAYQMNEWTWCNKKSTTFFTYYNLYYKAIFYSVLTETVQGSDPIKDDCSHQDTDRTTTSNLEFFDKPHWIKRERLNIIADSTEKAFYKYYGLEKFQDVIDIGILKNNKPWNINQQLAGETDYYCAFPNLYNEDGTRMRHPMTQEIKGNIECSNWLLIPFVLTKQKNGEGIYDAELEGIKIPWLTHPWNCIVEACNLILYKKGAYWIWQKWRGDSDCYIREEIRYNTLNNKWTQINGWWCSWPHNFQVKSSNNTLEIVPIITNQNFINTANVECSQVDFSWYEIKKDGKIIKTLPIPKENLCFEYGQNIPIQWVFDPIYNNIKVDIEKIDKHIIINPETLDYTIN